MYNNKEINNTKAILKMYVNFIDYLEIDENYVYINPVVLLDSCKRYWRDVDRLQTFHNITHIDCHKIAGYITYWISKLKPISIVKSDLYTSKFTDLAININEYFSLYVAIGSINDYYIQTNQAKEIKLTNSFVKSFIYTLKYRITTGDNLSLLYYQIDKNSK